MSTATLAPATPVILLKHDFEILNAHVKNLQGMQVNEKENFSKLSQELKKAKIVDPEDFPPDVVRLDSTVVIKDLQTNREPSSSLRVQESFRCSRPQSMSRRSKGKQACIFPYPSTIIQQ